MKILVSNSRSILRVIGLVLVVFVLGLLVWYFVANRDGKLSTSRTSSNFEQGKSLVSEGKYSDAVNYLEKAVKSDDTNREYRKELAVAQYNTGDYSAAVSSYEKLIEQNSDDAFAYNGLGNLYRDQGDLDKAVENYQKAVEVNPEFTVSYNNWAQVLVDQDKKDEAIKVLEDGIKANPGSDELKASLEIMKK